MASKRDELLKDILKSPECYGRSRKNKGQLKLNYVNEQLQLAKEVIFYDEVYFPYMQRLMRKVKAWGIIKTDWQTMSVGYDKCIVIDCPVELYFQDMISEDVYYILEKVWCGVEWSWPEPTLEECMSLIDIAEDYPLVQKALW